MPKKVFVGLSGGVDSAVSAALLLERGYEVEGIHLLLTGYGDEKSAPDAEAVAKSLGIPFHCIDMKEEFKRYVIDYFVNEYMNGRTPNPCIVCNEHIKFGLLLDKMSELGGDYLATGHYARIEDKGGEFFLKKSASSKDQSYFLYRLSQKSLSRTLFPVNEFEKSDTRLMAEKWNLPVAKKDDSQEICFIPDNDYVSFIKEYSGYSPIPGNFVDMEGNVIGQHSGIINYTIGQRKGLGVAFGVPMFVTGINPEKNEVLLAPDGYQKTSVFKVDNISFINNHTADRIRSDPGMCVSTKIRCQAKPMPSRISFDGELISVEFEEPQRAVTPGQSAVFYEGDTVLGGGFIQ